MLYIIYYVHCATYLICKEWKKCTYVDENIIYSNRAFNVIILLQWSVGLDYNLWNLVYDPLQNKLNQ